nr:helix-turn-helix transcriptional regulator [Qipengyuania sphaerica]
MIDDIYAALDDDALFNVLPELIAKDIGARSCAIQLWSPDLKIENHLSSYFPEEMNRYYVEHRLDQHDEWARVLFENRLTMGAFRTGDFQPVEEFCESFIYREFFVANGDDTARCLGFGDRRPDEGLVVVGLHRPRTAQEFSDGELARFDAIRPHITRLAVLRKRLKAAQSESEGARLIAGALRDAVFVLDDAGRINFANPAAEDLVRQRSILAIVDQRPIMLDRAAQLRFERALRAVRSKGSRMSHSIGLENRAGETWRLHVVPRTMGGETRVMLYFERNVLPDGAADRLISLYGLTETEAAIALMAASGERARDIGERRGISVPTVRTHLQHVFEKTDTHKVSELAKLVASLPSLWST